MNKITGKLNNFGQYTDAHPYQTIYYNIRLILEFIMNW